MDGGGFPKRPLTYLGDFPPFGLDDLLSCLIFGQTEMLKLGLEDMI